MPLVHNRHDCIGAGEMRQCSAQALGAGSGAGFLGSGPFTGPCEHYTGCAVPFLPGPGKVSFLDTNSAGLAVEEAVHR